MRFNLITARVVVREVRLQLRPLRNRVLVERVTEKVTAGGIFVPEDYEARASRKAVNRADHFKARVLAVGPEVTDALVVPGAEVQILTWSAEPDGTRRGMYTGVDGPDGTLFVNWPSDFAGYVYERAEAAE